MAGVHEARGEIIAWTHADLQTDVKDVYNGYEIFKSQSDQEKIFLKGSRKERPLVDYILTWGMGKISSIILGDKLNDINAQPKMFHRSFLENLTDAPDDFSLDLYLLYQARVNDYDILEYPVNFSKRLYGEAKGGGTLNGKWNLIKRTWAYMIELKNNLSERPI